MHNFFSCISVVFPPKKIILFRFWAISIAAQNGKVSGHFCSLWRMIWGRHARTHPLVSSASHNGLLLCTTCVYLVSLDYEISLPHPSPYHMSQQAADLVFEPTMKRLQKREKSNFERNFLPKSNSNFTYVRLCKKKCWKNCRFGPSVPL